jgi:phage tail-like protein
MPNLPLSKFHFIIDWGGTRIGFTEVSGLDIQVEVMEYREGSSKEYNVRKMPGLHKYANITMKRGLVKGDNEFFNWINLTLANKTERRDMTISLLDEEHKPVVTWKVNNAFPVKYIGPILNATSSEVAIESLEIAHEGLTVIND